MDRIRVLYIEDDEEQRRSLCTTLKAKDYDVLCSSSGEEGLSILEKEEIDLVLCDLNMPGMDGFAVLETIKARSPHIPVILLSAHGSIKLGVKAIKQGAFDFISKVHDMDEVDVSMMQASEHARVIKGLKATQKEMNLLLGTIPDLVYSLDPQGKIIRMNAAVYEILGYTPKELVDRSIFDLIDPEDHDLVKKCIKSAVERSNKSVVNIEYRMLTKSGVARYFEIRRRLIFSKNKLVQVVDVARDITTRKELKEELTKKTRSLEEANKKLREKAEHLDQITQEIQRTNANLKTIVDSVHNGLMLVNNEGKIREINDTALWLFDATEEKFLGASFEFFINKVSTAVADVDIFRQMVSALEAKPDFHHRADFDYHLLFHRVVQLRAHKGRSISLSSMKVSDEENNEIGRLWMFTDITKMLDMDEQVHSIIKASPIPLVISRIADRKILFANQPMSELLQIPLRELVDRSAPDFCFGPHNREHTMRELERVGEIKGLESKLMRRDGTSIWAMFSMVRSEIGGDPVVIASIYDIDARKKAEEDLLWERNFISAILDTAGALVVVLDPEGRVLRFNRTCQNLSGYSFEDVRGKEFSEIFFPLNKKAHAEEKLKKLQSGDFPQSFESVWKTKYEEERYIVWQSTALVDDHYEVEYIISTGIDITEQKLAQDALKEKQTQLVRSEKMASLGMLVAGIAHEINTPVGAINSVHSTLTLSLKKLKELIKTEFSPEQAANKTLNKVLKALDNANHVIGTGTSRVTNIVKRLRSFARLDEAELKMVDIHECLDDTLTIIHHEIKHKAEVKKKYGNVGHYPLFAGPINQVFLNLLINASQAIKDEGQIEIKTHEETNRIVVEISDSGHGIKEEDIAKIFDPGFTTKGVGVGTGLGLSICYQIIQDHRGEIFVDSKVGKGTTFTVKLPKNLDELLRGQSSRDSTPVIVVK